jgi:hypothetical protein
MRAKRQRLWLPDFPQLPINEGLLADLREQQEAGEAYYGEAILPLRLRELRPSIGVVPYCETELHSEGTPTLIPPRPPRPASRVISQH